MVNWSLIVADICKIWETRLATGTLPMAASVANPWPSAFRARLRSLVSTIERQALEVPK